MDHGVVVVPAINIWTMSQRLAFLAITLDLESGTRNMRLPAEQETGNVLGIPMEVDNDRLVSREEAVERVLSQGVRVEAAFSQDEKIIDVDDSDTDAFVPKKSGSSDHLKSHLNTTTNQHNVGVLSSVSRVSWPY